MHTGKKNIVIQIIPITLTLLHLSLPMLLERFPYNGLGSNAILHSHSQVGLLFLGDIKNGLQLLSRLCPRVGWSQHSRGGPTKPHSVWDQFSIWQNAVQPQGLAYVCQRKSFDSSNSLRLETSRICQPA